MKFIITPTDFSEISLNAVNYAADMALAIKATLLVMHANELSLTENDDFSESDYIEGAEEKLLKLKEQLLKRTNNKIEILTRQVSGIIENELIKICACKKPFAVVMATHGASFEKMFFVGSITVYLSKNLKYPVIVVPANVQYKPVCNIALASDLKDIYDLPYEKIAAVVNGFNAVLKVLHVNEYNQKCNSNSFEVSLLNEKLKHLNPQFYFINNKNVQQGLFSFVKENKIDMLLTFPKKHAFFHKSESKQIMFNSPVTVITLQ